MGPIQIPYAHRFHPNRRGRGLGGILRSVGNVIRPFFSQTKAVLAPLGKELTKQGISLLSNTAKDAINGVPLSNAFQSNFAKRKKKVIKKVKKTIGGAKRKKKGGSKRKGSGKAQKGRGKKASKGKGRKAGKGRGKTTKGKGRKRKVGRPKKKRAKNSKKGSIFDGYSL